MMLVFVGTGKHTIIINKFTNFTLLVKSDLKGGINTDLPYKIELIFLFGFIKNFEKCQSELIMKSFSINLICLNIKKFSFISYQC